MTAGLRLAVFSLAAAFFSVAFVAPAALFPFIGIKLYWFRFCISGALIAVLLYAGFTRRHALAGQAKLSAQIRALMKSPIFLAVSFFVFSFLAATVFAYDRPAAFWSNFERGEGGFQMVYYYLFFTLLLLVVRTWHSWRVLLWSASLASLLVAVYGVLAALNVRNAGGSRLFFGPVGISGWISERFSGSLGNPEYAGAYFMLMLFLTGFLFFDPLMRRWQSVLQGALAAVFFTFFIFAQSRGAFVGFGAGLIAVLLYNAYFSKTIRRLTVGIMAMLLILLTLVFMFRTAPLLRQTPLVGRFLRISIHDRSLQARVFVWEAALKGWLERPLFGWGPENFTTVFDAHFDVRHYDPKERSDTWYDRAHSVYFDYLVQTGIVGLTAFLAMFVVLFWRIVRREVEYRRAQSLWRPVFQRSLLFGFSVAYLIQGIVNFDVLPIYLLLFLFLALSTFILDTETHDTGINH
ncbi:MAG: O-antigen ligase family protein [Candidatus Liptonbacteria bacterium]|nr:O-antigen ligase family protein [Candidatus Liptonbacteria bacterium]